jgi:hypothetical protein
MTARAAAMDQPGGRSILRAELGSMLTPGRKCGLKILRRIGQARRFFADPPGPADWFVTVMRIGAWYRLQHKALAIRHKKGARERAADLVAGRSGGSEIQSNSSMAIGISYLVPS